MARRKNPEEGDYSGIAERIVPAADAEPHVKVLVYGRNGKGKTRFGATGPNPLIIDINEKGTRSVRRSNAEVMPVKTWQDIGNTYWFLKHGDHEYETVVIDTLTSMHALCLRFVMKDNARLDPSKEPDTPSKRDWGRAGKLMERWLYAYRNLPMHVIFLAQERVLREEETGEVELVTVDLPAGARSMALGSVEVIGRVFRRERRTKRGKKKISTWETLMLVGDHELYDSKDRTGALPRIMRQPTMEQIIEASLSDEEE